LKSLSKSIRISITFFSF